MDHAELESLEQDIRGAAELIRAETAAGLLIPLPAGILEGFADRLRAAMTRLPPNRTPLFNTPAERTTTAKCDYSTERYAVLSQISIYLGWVLAAVRWATANGPCPQSMWKRDVEQLQRVAGWFVPELTAHASEWKGAGREIRVPYPGDDTYPNNQHCGPVILARSL